MIKPAQQVHNPEHVYGRAGFRVIEVQAFYNSSTWFIGRVNSTGDCSVVEVDAQSLVGRSQPNLQVSAGAFIDMDTAGLRVFNAYQRTAFSSEVCCIDRITGDRIWTRRFRTGVMGLWLGSDTRIYVQATNNRCHALRTDDGEILSSEARIEDVLASARDRRVLLSRYKQGLGKFRVINPDTDQEVFSAVINEGCKFVGGQVWADGCLLCPVPWEEEERVVSRYDFARGLVWSSGPAQPYYVLTAFRFESRVFAIFRHGDTGDTSAAELDIETGECLRKTPLGTNDSTWCPYDRGSAALSTSGVLRLPSMEFTAHNLGTIDWL